MYIDTRDLAAELDELEAREDTMQAAAISPEHYTLEDLDPLDRDETERMAALRELRDEVGSEWPYGETMIPVDEFEEYAEELAADMGAIDENAKWPLSHIDWTAAAEELAQDYSLVTWEGVDYYVRTA